MWFGIRVEVGVEDVGRLLSYSFCFIAANNLEGDKNEQDRRIENV